MRAVGAVALGAVLALVLAATEARAQQVPQPLPAGNNQQDAHHQQVAITHWPTTAVQYHVYLTWTIRELQKLIGAPRSPITQGDINKFSLRLKDCEATVAADGYVTRSEFDMCERVWNQAFSDMIDKYVASLGGE